MTNNTVIKDTDLTLLKNIKFKKATFDYLGEDNKNRKEFIERFNLGDEEMYPPLAEKLANFNRKCLLDGNTGISYEAALVRRDRLIYEIENSEFDEETKDILYSGFKTTDDLYTRWPALAHRRYLTGPYHGPLKLALDGKGDSDINALILRLNILIKAMVADAHYYKTVFTYAAPNPVDITRKVTVTENAQALYLEFEELMRKDYLSMAKDYLYQPVTIGDYKLFAEFNDIGHNGRTLCRFKLRDKNEVISNIELYLNPHI